MPCGYCCPFIGGSYFLCWLQHVSAFTAALAGPAKGKAKAQLDCGGVATAVLAACRHLEEVHGHADLAAVRFQVGLR